MYARACVLMFVYLYKCIGAKNEQQYFYKNVFKAL